ncbi:MAG TPA: sugar ABC transporter permease [Geminicoccaceae bacterium]|nr:sugar ABC transporter permease [Geminicoccaceae bacterium]
MREAAPKAGTLSGLPRAGGDVGPRERVVNWIDRNLPIIFNVPTVLLLAGLVAFPVLLVLYTSMTDWFLYTPEKRQFVGFANYVAVWSDPRWLHAIWHTVYLTVGSVFFQFVLGLGIAMLFNRQFRGRTFYRSVFLLPMIAMSTAISLVWIIMFNNSFGLLNFWLASLGVEDHIAWLSDEHMAMPSLILVQVWHWTPFMTLLLLAGLQSLPSEPFEAAKLDGASPWQMLVNVTLPLLKGHIIVALILRSIFAIKEFDTILTMTEGGPNWATETMNMNIYFNAFDYGYTAQAAAKGVLFFLFILAIQVALLRFRERQWSY